jgi:hypothetical protein
MCMHSKIELIAQIHDIKRPASTDLYLCETCGKPIVFGMNNRKVIADYRLFQ